MTPPASLTKLAKNLSLYAKAVSENGKDWGKFEAESYAILSRLFALARTHGQNEMIAEVRKLEPRVGVSPSAAE